MTPEETRLRTALLDIAQGGGWQGRYAHEVLDGPPMADAPDASVLPLGFATGGVVWNPPLCAGDAEPEAVGLLARLREEARRQGWDLARLVRE